MITAIPQTEKTPRISFSDTQTAFATQSDKDLRFSNFIFSMMGNRIFVLVSSFLSLLALKLRLPVIPLIKATVFRQFCGGESMKESSMAIDKLGKSRIGAILDFAVEGKTEEKDFEETKKEILNVINFAKNNPHVPFACLKPTGIARFSLLEKVSAKKILSEKEKGEFENIRKRLDEICNSAYNSGKPIYIDAEETWIQDAIDTLAEEMMKKYNGKRAVVFTTLQMYRHDRLEYLQKLIQSARKENYFIGLKIVRGAYIEKENARAKKLNYPSPINPSKQKTDNDYDSALKIIIENIDIIELCAGTHNEESCLLLTELIREKNLPENHPHIYFSQLYGMSDNISFNLAAAGFNVTKYLPYGPVRSTIPYLIRRAQENTAIAGQMGKELKLIKQEIQRRKSGKQKI